MNKKIFLTLCLALVAISSTFAQSAIADGVYYLRAQDGRYLNRGQEYGTRAILAEEGLPVAITTNADGNSKIFFLDTGKYLFIDSPAYWNCYTDATDGDAEKVLWKFTAVEDNVFYMSSITLDGKYVKLDEGDERPYTDGSTPSAYIRWTPVSFGEYNAALKATLTKKPGDVNGDGETTIADITTEIDAINRGIAGNTYYIDNNEGATESDVHEASNIILGTSELPSVDESWKYAIIKQTIHPVQGNGYVGSCSARSMFTGEDVSSKYDNLAITTLHISTTISNVAGVSIISPDRAILADAKVVYRQGDEERVGNAETKSNSEFASSLQSDAVIVTEGNNGVYTAQILPVNLPNGIIVTVRTNDGSFYQQTFTDINVGGENNLTFTSTTTTSNWMSMIPGNLYYNHLSTPGAHDAATSGCSSYTYLSKCQEKNLNELLAAGVRMFDIRPGYYYNTTVTADNLYIYHGSVSSGVKYVDAITIFVNFLKNNPTESIAIVMSKENNKPTLSSWSDHTTEMKDVIIASHNANIDYFKAPTSDGFTLADYRGKICYFNRTGWNIAGSCQITPWIDDGMLEDYSSLIGGGPCCANIQDAYNASDDSKKAQFITMAKYASNNRTKGRYHFNYLSIAGALTNALTNHTKVMNPYGVEYINGNNVTGPLGYILGDYMASSSYSGIDLVKAIYNHNFKYVYIGQSE